MYFQFIYSLATVPHLIAELILLLLLFLEDIFHHIFAFLDLRFNFCLDFCFYLRRGLGSAVVGAAVADAVVVDLVFPDGVGAGWWVAVGAGWWVVAAGDDGVLGAVDAPEAHAPARLLGGADQGGEVLRPHHHLLRQGDHLVLWGGGGH